MKFSVVGFLFLVFCAQLSYADFVLLSNYTFNNSYSDILNNSANLVPVGAVTLGAGSLAFDRGEGLSLVTDVTAQDYAIEMDLQFTDLDSWNKLIDFQSRTVDAGLYINPSDEYLFYSLGPASAQTITTGTTYTFRLERESQQLKGFIDGVLAFTYLDPTDEGLSSTNELNFLLDDSVQNSEYSAGTISGLRLYVTAVPEPSSVVLTCLAVIGFAAARGFRKPTRCA